MGAGLVVGLVGALIAGGSAISARNQSASAQRRAEADKDRALKASIASNVPAEKGASVDFGIDRAVNPIGSYDDFITRRDTTQLGSATLEGSGINSLLIK